jgi:hypothetical protein
VGSHHSLIDRSSLNGTPNNAHHSSSTKAHHPPYFIAHPSGNQSAQESRGEEDTIDGSNDSGGMVVAGSSGICYEVQGRVPSWLPNGGNDDGKTESTEERADCSKEDDLLNSVSQVT